MVRTLDLLISVHEPFYGLDSMTFQTRLWKFNLKEQCKISFQFMRSRVQRRLSKDLLSCGMIRENLEAFVPSCRA